MSDEQRGEDLIGNERLEAERGVALGTAPDLGDGTHLDGDTAVVRCAAGLIMVAARGAQRAEGAEDVLATQYTP